MLKLRDFVHLPQLDPLFNQVVSCAAGLVIVAGLEGRSGTASAFGNTFLPSGRSTIFSILMQQILEAHPGLRPVLISKGESPFHVPRQMRYRLVHLQVEPPFTYADVIAEAVHRRPGLLVIDRLTPESVQPALQTALHGLRVIAQLDTVLWGSEILQQLVDFGTPPEALSGLAWVITIQRLATLCSKCKSPLPSDPSRLARLYERHPHLDGVPLASENSPLKPALSDTPAVFFQAKGCAQCSFTGRYGDIAIFDVYRPEGQTPAIFTQPSLLSLEEYILGLAARGYLPLDDLLHLETSQLRRMFNLLATSENDLERAKADLNRKLYELEAANRVLTQRTEILISLHDLAEALITSASLDDLASKVCRRASDLCGANRAVLYLRRSPDPTQDQAEVLAINGWEASLLHTQLDASLVFEPGFEPIPFNRWPPGVPRPASEPPGTKTTLGAGLRVPLIAQEHQVGVMIVHSAKKDFFAPGEVALLKTFANQAALAIQRAGLVEDLRAKITQLETAQAELVKKERLEHELELARQVQQSVLPRTFPQVPGYNFATRNQPARQVGGDFYDVIDLDEDHFGLVIGDVSDKGLPAALYMALTRSLILAEAHRMLSPSLVLSNVNRLLLELGELRGYVSVFYGVVQKATRMLVYTRAGHDYPWLFRQAAIQPLSGEGMVLGVMDNDELLLTEQQVSLQRGDRLVLYTDGLADAANPQGEFYGIDRLQALLLANASMPIQEMCDATFSTLAAYQSAAEQFDDMTMLVVDLA